MATTNAIIDELSTSQKLDGTGYDMWKRKIQYLLNERDLLGRLTVAKFPPLDKHKDGKPIDTTTVHIKKAT